MSDKDIERYIELLISQNSPSKRPRYVRMSADTARALIPDLLYQCRLLDTVESSTVALTMFLGLGDLGGALWEQEMRILERLDGLAHPSLPVLEDGGYLPDPAGGPGVAYIRTRTKGSPGDHNDMRRLFQDRRGDALAQLWRLADALAVLTDAHIAHRLLWPGNLDVRLDAGVVTSVRLSRFEMGALVSNLFDTGSSLGLARVKDLYLQQPSASFMYNPPERLRFLFGQPDGHLGGPKGDVFSLGMMAAEWLLGPADDGDPPITYEEILRRQEATRVMLVRRHAELPAALAETLTGMLEPDDRSRPTAYQVSQQVAAGYGDARAVLDDDLPSLPYLLAYMPRECDKILLPWNFITTSALHPDGRDELIDRIERDCRGAEILHSPDGAEGFAPGPLDLLRRAKTVIIGHEITWFASSLWMDEGSIVEYDEIMVIRFVRRTGDISRKLDALRVNALISRVPVVDVIAMPKEAGVAEAYRAGRPPWSSLVLKAESGRVLQEEEKSYLEALDWYLRYQRALLAARTYAYVLDPGSRPGRVVLRWDADTDHARMPDDPLQRRLILSTRRLNMADFVAAGGEQAGLDDVLTPQVSLASARQDFGRPLGPFQVLGTIGTEAIEVAADQRAGLPEAGWLRLHSDAGTMPQITRQAEARAELETHRVLLRQLIPPPPGSVRSQARPGLDTRWDQAGGELDGEGRQAVVAMLKQGALFALQGPPGTGKTEVTAQAVAEYVSAKPRARILVSAQSHNALENLAGRILDKLGMTPSGGRPARLDRLALRVEGSRERDEVDQRVAAFRPARLAEGMVRYSTSRAQHWLASRRTERPELTPVVQEWLSALPNTQLELNRRARAAANIVFATTGGASQQNLVLGATDEPFHWVLVEEAARAWPTELALPLVRGVRWTLIGDHAQIGAFSSAEIARFLLECKDHKSPEIDAMYQARESYTQAFGTFAGLFMSDRPDVARMTLTQEYRMEEQITDMVGSIFYAGSGGLTACREPAQHPLAGPDYLLGSRLVWIDTGRAERAQGFWSNENEADLCARVIRAMDPAGATDRLAVLTPYRKQRRLLAERLTEHAGRVFTVDGFQGHEADIVVASLVRDRVGRDGTPVSSVGHVASPTRANVMLSRARDLLVLVGRWEIYANHAGPKWREVAEYFRDHGSIVQAEEVRS